MFNNFVKFIKDWVEVLIFFLLTAIVILILLYKFLGVDFMHTSDEVELFATLQAETIDIFTEKKGIAGKVQVNGGDAVSQGQILAVIEDKNPLTLPESEHYDLKSNMVSRVFNIELAELNMQGQIFEEELKIQRITQQILNQQSMLDIAKEKHNILDSLYQNRAATIDEINRSSADIAKISGEIELLKVEQGLAVKMTDYYKSKKTAMKKDALPVYDMLDSVNNKKSQQQEQYNHSEIISPVTGVILSSYITEGLYIPPNQKIFTLIFTDKFKVYLKLSSKFLNLVGTSQKCEFRASQYPNDIFDAKVLKISGDELEVEVYNKDGKLKPGINGIITINKNVKK